MTTPRPTRNEPCTRCGELTRAKSGVCGPCGGRCKVVGVIKRPRLACGLCGAGTERESRVCQGCQHHITAAAKPPKAADALPPGRWVPDGRGRVVFRASVDGLPVRRVA